MTEISVIVPVYNAERYVAECLDALCAQTFEDIEILCVDDGSVDGTGHILSSYADKDRRVRILTQPNAGPAAARNLGLKNANGRYIMFCDADDWYQFDCCEQMLKLMEREKPDIAVCRCNVVLEELDAKKREHTAAEAFYNSREEGLRRMNDELRVTTSVVLWNKIFRREFIERFGIYFPEGCEHDDDAFWMLCGLFADSIYFSTRRLYNYRIRANSIMSNYFNKKPKNKYDRYKVCNFVYDFLQKKELLAANLSAVSDFYRRQVGMMYFDLFSSAELAEIVGDLNNRHLDYLFAFSQGKIISARRQGIENAGWWKLCKYALRAKLARGDKGKMLKQEKRVIRSQIKIKKVLQKQKAV